MTMHRPWTYKGIDIWPADPNSSGIRWYARMPDEPKLRADTKTSMRELINHCLSRKEHAG